jgi:CCR4-NOT transcription complex subunit 4
MDDEDDFCPLCVEAFGLDDHLFLPCVACDFKICLFCWQKVKETGNGCCPACRCQLTAQPMMRPGMTLEE